MAVLRVCPSYRLGLLQATFSYFYLELSQKSDPLDEPATRSDRGRLAGNSFAAMMGENSERPVIEPLMDRRTQKQTNARISKLKDLLAQPRPHRLVWYHRIGELVAQLQPRGRRRYGEFGDLLNQLADSFATKSASRESRVENLRGVLDSCCRLYEIYSIDELEALSNPPSGTHALGWSHLRHLLTLPTAERRRLQRATIQGRWSSLRLLEVIQRTHGRRGVGGRKPHAAKDAGHALRQMVRQCQTLARKVREVWLDETSPVLTDATVRELRRRSPDLVSEADAALAKLSKRIVEMRRVLRTPSRR